MTPRPTSRWAAAVLAPGVLCLTLGAGTAVASHCDNDPGTTAVPDCEPSHVVLDVEPMPADADCDPTGQAAVADWAATWEPCSPDWATDPTVVSFAHDPQVASILGSIRVLLAVGLATLLLFSAATFVLVAVSR